MPPQSSAPLEFTTDPSGNHHHDVHLHFAAGPVISPDKRKVRRSHYPDINKASHMPPAILLRQKPPREEETETSWSSWQREELLIPVSSRDAFLTDIGDGSASCGRKIAGRYRSRPGNESFRPIESVPGLRSQKVHLFRPSPSLLAEAQPRLENRREQRPAAQPVSVPASGFRCHRLGLGRWLFFVDMNEVHRSEQCILTTYPLTDIAPRLKKFPSGTKKMNVDGVDSDSEIDEAMTDTPPDIADEASGAKQDLLWKKSGDPYNIENVDHRVEDLYFFTFCEKKGTTERIGEFFLLYYRGLDSGVAGFDILVTPCGVLKATLEFRRRPTRQKQPRRRSAGVKPAMTMRMIHVINKCSLLTGKLVVVGGPVRKKLKGIVKVSSIRHFDLTPNPKKSDKGQFPRENRPVEDMTTHTFPLSSAHLSDTSMVVEMEFLRDSRISQESGNVNGEIFAINIERTSIASRKRVAVVAARKSVRSGQEFFAHRRSGTCIQMKKKNSRGRGVTASGQTENDDSTPTRPAARTLRYRFVGAVESPSRCPSSAVQDLVLISSSLRLENASLYGTWP
ncbi:hypothetical protein GEV33_013279 [Tenebrio molitor]|uniref:Uncharacterized protein n=1 Tax=Tenebrio molitor TaxID=7067 RepID=A0A8J6L7I0_TENMO|nr:hypothetical protein GEV33_013279 [Tenebrio molitor]